MSFPLKNPLNNDNNILASTKNITFLFHDKNDYMIIDTHIKREKKETPKQTTPSSFSQAAKSYYRFNPIKTFPGLSLLWSFS